MCGIAGIYDYRERAPASPRTLAAMLEVIRHRGPDDQGTWVAGPVALGMRRLAIIDLASGHQPLYNEDRSLTLVFNGEIYNFRELRRHLAAAGHRLAGAGDGEVILHLYEDHGDRCVEHLRGMFAFALWDTRRRRLLLARDRLGVKPLYYADLDGRLVFGSEIKAILQDPRVPRAMDEAALGEYLSLRYVPAPATLFQGIRSLPPGFTATIDHAGMRLRRYWDLSFAQDRTTPPPREDEAAEALAAHLRESVRLRLMSDVPFGAFLSGGVDSSTVVALMSAELAMPVKTFGVGFEGADAAYSELTYARRVAERFATDHHEVLVGARDFVDASERLVWHLDQPIADAALIAYFRLCEAAGREVKMVLTGEGGDELFAGYGRYSGERLSPLFRHLPAPLAALPAALGRALPGLRRPKLMLQALRYSDEAQRLRNWFPLFDDHMRPSLLGPGLRERLGDGPSGSAFHEHLHRAGTAERLHRMLYVDTKVYLPDYLLARGDKLSMAASLEARVPLLDHELAAFAASLPAHYKQRGLARKRLLKRVAADWLPEAIIHRKKAGFSVPVCNWLRGPARPFARDLLAPDTLRRRGLFDPRFVGELLERHERGLADHTTPIVGLIHLELWQRLYLDGAADAGRMAATPAPASAEAA